MLQQQQQMDWSRSGPETSFIGRCLDESVTPLRRRRHESLVKGIAQDLL
jgi:hypothetical protein